MLTHICSYQEIFKEEKLKLMEKIKKDRVKKK